MKAQKEKQMLQFPNFMKKLWNWLIQIHDSNDMRRDDVKEYDNIPGQ